MSNGYPGSGSPLDAGCTPSPSPGPAPSPHRHGHKSHGHAPPPHHSPRHNNLRVVIPSSMPPPQDDISYAGEVNTSIVFFVPLNTIFCSVILCLIPFVHPKSKLFMPLQSYFSFPIVSIAFTLRLLVSKPCLV